MSGIFGDIRLQRIAEAKDIICSCIIFSIHDKATQDATTFCIDYITNDFTNLADVVNQYLCNGNKLVRCVVMGVRTCLRHRVPQQEGALLQ